MAAPAYNPQTGDVEQVDDSAVQAAEPISVINPQGQFEQVGANEAGSLLALGYKLDTEENRHELENERKYGQGREVESASLGLARGLSFGLSDLALAKTGLYEGEELRQLEEKNQLASLGGEVAAFAIPALGAMKAVGTVGRIGVGALRAAGAGVEAASLVGRGLEAGAGALGRGAVRALGMEAEGLAAKTLATYAPRALGIAGEAELYQIGHNLSQAVMKDQDLTAEVLLANSDNALMLGGALGLGGPLAFRAGRSLVDRALPEVAKEAARASAEIVSRSAKNAIEKVAKFFDPDRALQLYSGAMSNGRLLEKADIKGQKFQRAVRELREDGFYRPGKVVHDGNGKLVQIEKGSLPGSDEAFQRLEEGMASVGDAMGELLKAGKGAKLSQDVSRMTLQDAKRMSSMLTEWRTNRVIGEAEASRLGAVVNDIGAAVNEAAGDLERLHKLRRGLDERIGGKNWDKLGTEEIQAIKEMRKIVSEKIDMGAKELAAQGVLKDGEAWGRLNRLYRNLATIKGPLDKARGKIEANVNVLGLRWRDMIMGDIVGNAGRAAAGDIGGAAGIFFGGLNKILQTDKGLLFRAQLGERFGSLIQANKAFANVGQRIAAATSAFAGKTAKTALRGAAAPGGEKLIAKFDDSREHERELAAAKSRQDRFRVQVKSLSSLVQDPGVTAERIANNLQGADHLAPELRDKLVTRQLATYAYLYDKAPKDPLAAYGINPAVTKWTPSEGEIERWNRHVKTANDPLSILDDLKEGTVTPEAAETVRVLYPRLFTEIQADLTSKIGQMQEQLSYQDRFNLGIVFDVPTDPSLAPEFVESLLSRFDEQSAAAGVSDPTAPIARASGANQMSADETMTRTQEINQ